MNALETAEKFYDIYDIWYIPWWKQWWFIGTVIFLIIISSIVGVVLVRLYFKKERPVDLWELLLRQVQQLEKEESQSPKQFYLQLTFLLKQFLQERYGVFVVGCTDDEMLAVLERSNVSPSLVKDIKTLLHGVVFIKFANQIVAQQQMEQGLTLMKKIIEESRLRE